MTIEVQGLTRTFDERVAVDDVSFLVADGAVTGFVGGNGAGKTTTMRMVMGLLTPDAGAVLWQGRPITAADRRATGYLPEERGLYQKQKVLDQLVYIGELSGMPRGAARDSALGLLDRFGLADRAGDRVEKLSLGNQQRVQVTAALMSDPSALVLDEPFSGLDPDSVDAMADLLRERAAHGIPLLFSSHQLDLVERLCDRIVVLRQGRVVVAGAVADLRSSGPRRFRLVVAEDAGWVRGVRGVTALDVDGPRAVLDLGDDPAEEAAARRTLLTEALARGDVLELAPVVPTLADIYREVAS